MPDLSTNLVVSALAKGSMAQLREVVKVCDDRDTAQSIYRELTRLAHELARKHNFTLSREKLPERVNV